MARDEIERLARLEVIVERIEKEQLEASLERRSQTAKLDELLALRHKGVGAFWLASALLGTGIVGFFQWLFKGATL